MVNSTNFLFSIVRSFPWALGHVAVQSVEAYIPNFSTDSNATSKAVRAFQTMSCIHLQRDLNAQLEPLGRRGALMAWGTIELAGPLALS
jgi:hypothetical protein